MGKKALIGKKNNLLSIIEDAKRNITAGGNGGSKTEYAETHYTLRDSMLYNTAVAAGTVHSLSTFSTCSAYNMQYNGYIKTINTLQNRYIAETKQYMSNVINSGKPLTASNLRNKGNWMNVKKLVVREELMKMQFGGKSDIPFTSDELKSVSKQIENMDLSSVDDKVNTLTETILTPDDRKIIMALKAFRKSGTVSELFQKERINELREILKDVDLDKLSGSKEYKSIRKKYVEVKEGDHRESISSDPNKQSVADNVSMRNTSDHRKSHGNDFTKPKKEALLNRKRDLRILNNKRIIKQNLSGLGAAVAIAAGVGFSIGFICTLAECGLTPDTLKNAFVAGAKASVEGAIFGGIGFEIGATFGGALANGLKDVITSGIKGLAEKTIANIGKMCNMAIVGVMMIVITSVYQFVKLKQQGFSTKESIIRVGKSAAISILILGLTIAAQGIWGGYWGLIVSIAASVTVMAIQTGISLHEKKVRTEVENYRISLYVPQFT